ncbi:hypothetical protein LTR37_015497 [Vermiconidia calcicola]|uniref:Uncharacterized protein n=1 Tax=Vermiconidia calcicola TaxID=1690605 RepID=A0ACC3MQT4_9PEZI|nr:hypothetical protein LTR37_015497 [Vermiconidia calcicola]
MGMYWTVFLLFFFHCLADRFHFKNYEEYAKLGDAPRQTYRSSPALSPLFNVDIWNEEGIDTDAPYIFFSTGDGLHQGPYIFSSKDLSLVYADRHYNASNNARVQRYKGKNYLTFWEGSQGKGHAEGVCHIVNTKYEIVHSIQTKNLRAKTDLHECELTNDGTALITVYETIPFDLSSIGGKVKDYILDSVFQEIDIETGKLLFEWRGSAHIPVTESYSPYEKTTPKTGWDACHINGIQKDRNGDYYLSLRRMHSLVKVSGKDGSRLWQLGGKGNNFTDLSDGHATDFAWQHHMRFLDDDSTQLTVFDNRNLHGEKEVHCVGDSCSRGARIALDYQDMTARLLQSFYSPNGLLSYAMGGYDTTPRGNALIGWGSQAAITEFSPDGVPVMNFQFGKLGTWMRTYRVYKGHWEAYPPWPPGIAVERAPEDCNMFIFASWNGATEVKFWIVAVAETKKKLDDLKSVRWCSGFLKVGFESMISYDGNDAFVRVVAVDKNSNVLGATSIVDTKTGKQAPGKKPAEKLRYDFGSSRFKSNSWWG